MNFRRIALFTTLILIIILAVFSVGKAYAITTKEGSALQSGDTVFLKKIQYGTYIVAWGEGTVVANNPKTGIIDVDTTHYTLKVPMRISVKYDYIDYIITQQEDERDKIIADLKQQLSSALFLINQLQTMIQQFLGGTNG